MKERGDGADVSTRSKGYIYEEKRHQNRHKKSVAIFK